MKNDNFHKAINKKLDDLDATTPGGRLHVFVKKRPGFLGSGFNELLEPYVKNGWYVIVKPTMEPERVQLTFTRTKEFHYGNRNPYYKMF